MKKNVMYCGCFCLVFCACAHAGEQSFALGYDHAFAVPDTYKTEARAWFDTYLASASVEDLSLILNLVYSAWARSQANIAVQARIEKTRAVLSDLTHAFTLTRLTPALYARRHVDRAPDFFADRDVLDTRSLESMLAAHKNISLAYHWALDYVVDQKKCTSPLALVGVNVLRRSARAAVAQALASLPRHLDDIVAQTHVQLMDVIEKFSHNKLLSFGRQDGLQSGANFKEAESFVAKLVHQELRDLIPHGAINASVSDERCGTAGATSFEQRGAADFLWKYIQRFFARAFFNADRAYAHGWYACDQALLLSQSVHNALWQIMEEVRAAYYSAHYEVIYTAIEQRGALPRALCRLFDANGMLPDLSAACPTILPSPHSLSARFALS